MVSVYGGIEAGGTKIICAVGSGPGDIRAETRFSTTTPDETLGRAVAFFEDYRKKQPLASIGIASFGPVDLNQDSPTYGYITATPKPGWSNVEFAGVIERELGLPVGFDTDVNGALMGEHRWGAAQGIRNAIYLTVGTGIGGGALVNGNLLHGLVHPEMGHILIQPRNDDPMPGGYCPFHGNCLEGMASGPAIETRWGVKADTLPPDHPAWELEAHYLSLALHAFICVMSPQRIILGGGVMDQEMLFPMIRQKVHSSLNGYVKHPLLEKMEEYIVPPVLGSRAGVLGAIALAQHSAKYSVLG
jgi:fructokinase